ncbi:c-type cytochrome [Parapedobacter defluvii]|uniref:DUF7133 domain-containing protein n=1 Tax=Parapedobacter defluvii TaxID=2045106 RepID=UPI00333F01FF
MKRLSYLSIVVIIALMGAFMQCTSDRSDLGNENRSPEAELAGFSVPEGFVVELVASERDGIINPVQLTFDDRGQLWTQTARMYPLDPIADIKWNDLLKLMDDSAAQAENPEFKRVLDLYQGKTKGEDQILVLSGLYGRDGVKSTVWADGLAIPMSILPYKDGAYVAQGSELFFLADTNQDGKADERTPLFGGFGFTDTHTMAHVLTRGPGGWVYFSHGALNKGLVTSYLNPELQLRLDYSKIAKFSLDGTNMELVSAGLNNIWGFQLRGNGQWYGTEANDLGLSIVPMEPGSGFRGIGNERLRPYQPWIPELHEFRVGGTGISGLAFADDLSGSFPSEWKDVAFLANPITSTINAVRIVRNSDGTVTAEHLPDFLTSEDKFFRPVNMEFGPDGALYIADWYNKIISHNEVPTTHPDRDKLHGRIWRIRHVDQKPREVPDFYAMSADDVVNQLKSESLWAKRAAWHQITDRPWDETSNLIPGIVSIIQDESLDETTRIVALWSLEGLSHYDPQLMNTLLRSSHPNLRREAVRTYASFRLDIEEIGNVLKNAIDDPNPMVRSQLLRTLFDVGKANETVIDILVRACRPEIAGDGLGGPYERKFERYLARKALERYPEQLSAYMNGTDAAKQPATNLLWAIQALPKDQKEKLFFPLWRRANLKKLDESTFVWLAGMLDNPNVVSLVRPIIQNPKHAAEYVGFYLNNQQQIQSEVLSSLVEGSVKKLLRSTVVDDRRLALEAISKLSVDVPGGEVAALISSEMPSNMLNLVLAALGNDVHANKDVFLKIIKNKGFDFEARIVALNRLSQAEGIDAYSEAKALLTEVTDEQARTFTSVLSGSNQGAAMLAKLYGEKLIGAGGFTLSSAERVYNAVPSDTMAATVLRDVQQAEEDAKNALHSRLEAYMAIAAKENGNADKGKILFQTCLLCHRVGQEGQEIAPALDGSAARDAESLLTAILDPDAAVEGGYAVYRITKKDNSVVEGYLYNKDDNGIMISSMGGNQTFVQMAEIKNHGFLGGRSFMPKGLIDNYTEEQVADLLAYIQTLK